MLVARWPPERAFQSVPATKMIGSLLDGQAEDRGVNLQCVNKREIDELLLVGVAAHFDASRCASWSARI